jgi:hypothetical protein
MIYFIECRGRVKIGYSVDPAIRFNKIAADAPFECALLGVMAGDRRIEAMVHEKWKHLRRHREWFSGSGELLSWIEANAVDHKAAPSRALDRFPLDRGARILIAKACGVSPSTVTQWKKVPAEYCAKVSAITGVSQTELRPDVFGHSTPSLNHTGEAA